jgi:protein-S-isoprenylcysteine O-methyltransferase Ste14
MLAFFVKPVGYTPGMTLIASTGILFSALHLIMVGLAQDVPFAFSLAAIVLYAISVSLFWWAIAVNRKSPLSAAFSPDAPQHITNQGPYQIVRHPFYCSYLLAWTAGVFASYRWWLAITPATMLIVYWRAARWEENKFAHSSLAERYAAYRAEVGMLMPNPLKFLRSVPRH